MSPLHSWFSLTSTLETDSKNNAALHSPTWIDFKSLLPFIIHFKRLSVSVLDHNNNIYLNFENLNYEFFLTNPCWYRGNILCNHNLSTHYLDTIVISLPVIQSFTCAALTVTPTGSIVLLQVPLYALKSK